MSIATSLETELGVAANPACPVAVRTARSVRLIVLALAALAVTMPVGRVRGAEYHVGSVDRKAPLEGLSPQIAEKLSEQAVEVTRGSKQVLCEIWLCQKWPVRAGFQPGPQVLYPFEPGELVGVIRYKRRGNDFRDQRIDAGLYTLRYGQQPVDGNHIGTSPTRDFLCLVRAEDDPSADRLDPQQLIDLSATAAGSTHPLLLCLQRSEGGGKAPPTIRSNSDRDWWIVRLEGKASHDAKTSELPVDLVIVGNSGE